MSETEAALVWCPFPDPETARNVAKKMLAEKFVACANILPPMESVFEWDGAISSDRETAVLFKTTGDRLEGLIVRLGECHPYDTPAIIGWRCDSAHPATKTWLIDTIEDR